MKKFLSYLFLAGVIGGFSADLFAFDAVNRWFRERYDRFMLGDPIYDELNKDCQKFEGEPQKRRALVNRLSTPPRLKFAFLGEESLFSYAQELYRDIVHIMKQLEEALNDIQPTNKERKSIFEINLGVQWREIYNKLSKVIEGNEKSWPVTAEQIETNRADTVTLLKQFKEKLLAFINEKATVAKENPAIMAQVKNAEKTITKLDNAIERLSWLPKKRLTRFERWYRNALLKRVEQYVYTRCPLK